MNLKLWIIFPGQGNMATWPAQHVVCQQGPGVLHILFWCSWVPELPGWKRHIPPSPPPYLSPSRWNKGEDKAQVSAVSYSGSRHSRAGAMAWEDQRLKHYKHWGSEVNALSLPTGGFYGPHKTRWWWTDYGIWLLLFLVQNFGANITRGSG